jgi:hypothetical protein
VRVYGEDAWSIPSARAEVIGWVASAVPEFRRLLIEDAPGIVLSYGDPEVLTDAEILKALTTALKREDRWFDPRKGVLLKLARATLETHLVKLLSSDASARGRKRLLRWASAGAYASAAPSALRIALSQTETENLRCAAIRCVLACASDEEKRALCNLADEPSAAIRDTILEYLVEAISGSRLVDFVLRGGDYSFRYWLNLVTDRIAVADLDAVLERLLPQLRSHVITSSTEAMVDIACVVVLARLRRPNPDVQLVLDTLEAIERGPLKYGRTLAHARRKDHLESALRHRPALRRGLWERRLARKEAFMAEALGRTSEDDVAWLFSLSESQPDWRQPILFGLSGIVNLLSEPDRDRLLESLDASSGVHAAVGDIINRSRAFSLERRRREDEEAQKDAKRREHISAGFEPLRTEIEQGRNTKALGWALQHLQDSLFSQGQVSLDGLDGKLSDDLIQAFRSGFKACWRGQTLGPAEGGNRGWDNEAFQCGLVGLALDAKDGLDFAVLTSADAELAARYALLAFNGFPTWFDELIEAHRVEVKRVLRESVSAEWENQTETMTSLARASSEPKVTAELLSEIAVELLEDSAPKSLSTLRGAIDAIFAVTALDRRVPRLIEESLANERDLARMPQWLRGWAHARPTLCAEWFETRLDSGTIEPTLFIVTAELLEDDLGDEYRPVRCSAFSGAEALERWSMLLLSHVRPRDDMDRSGFSSKTARGEAEDLRRRTLSLLTKDTSIAARYALQRVVNHPEIGRVPGEGSRRLAEQHACACDAAAPVWSEQAILESERGDDKRPVNIDELFGLVRRHIRDVARSIEEGEFSYRDLFVKRDMVKSCGTEI